MADGDNADESETAWGAEGPGYNGRIGLRRTGDPAGTEAMRNGREEKVLCGGAAIFHGAGGGSRENEYTKGGAGDELCVAQKRWNAGE